MDTENTDSITVCSNYSGACEHEPLTNDNILQITKAKDGMIDGPTLFALKYRMFPCTSQRRSDKDKKNTEKYKNSGVYHTTRLVN